MPYFHFVTARCCRRAAALRRGSPITPREAGRLVTVDRHRGLAVLLALAALGRTSSGAAAESPGGPCGRIVVSGDADYQPLSWFDGKDMRGAAETIVAAALTHMNLPFELREDGPFKRVLADAETGDVDIVAELKKTPEREVFLRFSSTPLFVNPVAVFTHRNRNLELPRREDLIGLRGGIVIANQFGGGLDEFLAQRLTVEELPRLELGLKMLELDRLDYFITSYYPGMSYLIERGWTTTYTIQRPYIAATENYVGISRQSRCAAELGSFDGTLATMAQDGEIERLFDAATKSWRAKAAQGE